MASRVPGPGGQGARKHFDRKIDATRWLAGREVAKTRGEWLDPALSKVRVGYWSRAWLDGQVQLKPSTRARYDSALRCQVLPTWEDVPLSAVSHADVSSWVQALVASGLAPASVRYAHRVLALVLAHALRDGRIVRNVAEGVRLPRVVSAEKRFLDHEQVDRLSRAAPGYELLVQVLAYTGVRWGELAALKVGRVDLVRRRLVVAEATSEVSGRVIVGTPKSHQLRSVPLPASWSSRSPNTWPAARPRTWCFTSPDGRVLRNTNFGHRVFDAASRKAGLDGFTPHELRHTAASLAVAAGANVKAVQMMLGHASAAMTLDVYAGLFGNDLDAVADRLHEAWAARNADQVRTGTPSEESQPVA